MDLHKRLLRRRGQNTVEYLMMVTVVVGVVLVSGTLLKKFMPSLFNNIQQMISDAAGATGSGSPAISAPGSGPVASTQRSGSPAGPVGGYANPGNPGGADGGTLKLDLSGEGSTKPTPPK